MPPEEWTKIIIGIATGTLGFLFALLVNSYVELRREKKTYRSMSLAIKAEAASNKVILQDSFLKFYRDGIVLRPFCLEAGAQFCANALFIKHATSTELEILNAYLRDIRLANAYREKAETFRLESKGKASQEWLGSLLDFWADNLQRCRSGIDEVLGLGKG